MWEVEDLAAALAVALLMDTRDDLAVEAAQQFLEFLAQHSGIGTVLGFTKGGAQDLLIFLARKTVEEGVEARQVIRLGQHQIDGDFDLELASHLVQAGAYLTCQGFQGDFVATGQLNYRDSNENAIERARSPLAP